MSATVLSPNDPALIALNEIAAALDGMTREEQLRVLSAACATIGDYEHAQAFLEAASESAPPAKRVRARRRP